MPINIGHLAKDDAVDGSIASLTPGNLSADDFERLVLSDEVSDGVALCAAIHDGLSMDFVRLLIKAGALNTALLIDHGIVPKRTWAHAEKHGSVSAATARRLVRFMRVYGKAKQTFGDHAVAWLQRPSTALAGAAPLALAEADPGARAVEVLLGRIDHGVAA